MTRAEKTEVALIPTLAAAAWLLSPSLPATVSSGGLFLIASALLLGQSLLRDLWLLFATKRSEGPPQRAQCMCLESMVGVTGVVVGLSLVLGGLTSRISVSPGGWAALSFGALAAGFLIKDLVFEWRPWRIRVDKDHMNIIPIFRR